MKIKPVSFLILFVAALALGSALLVAAAPPKTPTPNSYRKHQKQGKQQQAEGQQNQQSGGVSATPSANREVALSGPDTASRGSNLNLSKSEQPALTPTSDAASMKRKGYVTGQGGNLRNAMTPSPDSPTPQARKGKGYITGQGGNLRNAMTPTPDSSTPQARKGKGYITGQGGDLRDARTPTPTPSKSRR